MRYDYRIVRPDGAVRDLVVEQIRLRTPDGGTEGFIGVIDDVTERRALEEQVRQSQKLEAVGQLAGGVAHDSTICSRSSALRTVPDARARPRHTGSRRPRGAAERDAASRGTHAPAAHVRPQAMSAPKLLEPNAVVHGVEQMVRRLIGEHIALVTDLEPDVGRVLVDPGQLEQVLVNLAVNARMRCRPVVS